MQLKACFLALLCTVSSAVFAQEQKIDSLESLLSSIPADTTKVVILNELVAALTETDTRKALTYGAQSIDLAGLLRFERGLATALRQIAWVHYRRGDFSQSLSDATKALAVSETIGDFKSIALSRNCIAAIYFEEDQFDYAVYNFKDALKFASQTGDTETISRCLNNIAYTYFAKKEIDSAVFYSRRALDISNQSGHRYTAGFAHRTLGDAYFEKNDQEKAMENYRRCLELALQIKNHFLQASVQHRMGKLLKFNQHYDSAISLLMSNVTLANRYKFNDELERTYNLLAQIHHERNDLSKAYHFQSRYIAVRDSIDSKRNLEQIALIQNRYDAELKEAKIQLLTKEDALKEEQIKRQQSWIYFVVGCLILLLTLASVLFYNNHRTKNAKSALEENNNAIEKQTRELQSLNATKDKIFSIISHDLRSPVASLKALMEIVNTDSLSQEEFVSITKVLKRNLDTVYDDLNTLLLWARSQLTGLHSVPTAVNLFDLVESKVQLFSEQAGLKQLKIVNAIPRHLTALADPNHVALVIRNLLANAIKYNRYGGTVRIDCQHIGEALEVVVKDNGVGIAQDDLLKLFNRETHFTRPGTQNEKGIGIGLLLAKEFVEKNDGDISVESVKGEGAVFKFTLKALSTAEVV